VTRKPNLPLSSGQPDAHILAVLGRVQSVCLLATALVAGSVLTGWLILAVGRMLPGGWDLTKANTAVLILASCISLTLWQPRRSPRSLLAARIVAGFIVLLAAATLAEYLGHISLHLDTLLAPDSVSPLPGRLSLQTAWSFLLMGTILANLRARKSRLATSMDLLTLGLALMVLTFISAYAFGALHLYGLSLKTRIAPQTLFCVSLLTLVIVNRRAEYGALSILLGDSIGGKTARLAAPWALCLPFLLSIFRALFLRFTSVPPEYCLAVSASIMGVFGFCLVVLLSQKTNRLENEIRELSLRDELTKLYNRRGFYLLGEQALLLARRAGSPFFVLFVDMDNLKSINDDHGHDLGSECLKQLAMLLQQTFRETDVMGRLGGDEFVVAGSADESTIAIALDRLRDAAAQLAFDPATPHPCNFSLGYVVSRVGSGETLEELIETADAMMYDAKREKKQTPIQPILAAGWRAEKVPAGF
jgi:diguanylate cyclase (GGDEF)-like protein